jgi:hypothetical protein
VREAGGRVREACERGVGGCGGGRKENSRRTERAEGERKSAEGRRKWAGGRRNGCGRGASGERKGVGGGRKGAGGGRKSAEAQQQKISLVVQFTCSMLFVLEGILADLGTLLYCLGGILAECPKSAHEACGIFKVHTIYIYIYIYVIIFIDSATLITHCA